MAPLMKRSEAIWQNFLNDQLISARLYCAEDLTLTNRSFKLWTGTNTCG
jgi:hypothetical protein